MATTFEFVNAVPTDQILGGGQTQPVQQVTARAIPSGVQFSTVVAQVDYKPGPLGIILSTIAKAINKANAVPGVADVNLYQDVNNQGQFQNRLDVTVQSTSGNSSAIIHPVYGALFDARFAEAVQAERDLLDSIEAL